MAYQRLILSKDTPPLVRQLITKIENLRFSDVHTMLRLPLPDYELGAGCTFAIADVLLAVIGGVSSTFYNSSGDKHGRRNIGKKFQNLLIEFYPWDSEPSLTLEPAGAAAVIYDVFRNPLAHTLGLSDKARGRKILIKRLQIATSATGLREKEIESLERNPRPSKLTASVKKSDREIELFIEPFYWGVRHMIETLTMNKNKMAVAERFLTEWQENDPKI